MAFASTADDGVTVTLDTVTNNMGEDDQCVYTVETACGAPGFSIDSTSSVGNDDFAIFYLDFLAGDAGLENADTATVALADGTAV